MTKALDLVGHVSGRLTVLSRAGSSKDGESAWNCLCECGKKSIVRGRYISSGRTKSCGCLNREAILASSTHHGHARTGNPSPEYCSWAALKDRCLNPKNKDFKNYGDRGIAVCDRWVEFSNFIADMGPRPDGKSIDRINNDGPYSPVIKDI